MVSKDHKRPAMPMCRNLRLLRSITKSHARNETSVVLDASQYIQGLKRKLEKLDEAVLASAHNLVDYDPIPMPMLKVDEEEKGFVIRVVSERNCEGLLIFILEAIEELDLDVVQARATCVDGFCLEAVGTTKEDNEEAHHMNAQLVQQIVLQAIQNWRANNHPATLPLS